MKDRTLKGFIYGIIASAAYGMNPVFAVPLYDEGMDPISVLFFRYLLGIPAVWLLMRLRGRHAMIGAPIIGRISLLGVLMALSSVTLFFSYNNLDVSIASTILFVYPLLVALIMVIFYHEIMSYLTYFCMLGAIVGVFLLCKSSTEDTVLSSFGVFLVLVSAISYAVYIVLVNHRPYKSVATLTLTFWVMAFGLATLAIIVCVRGRLDVPVTLGMWFNAVMLAIVPTVISFLFTNMAIENIGATSTAALGVFEPLTAVIFGVLMFGETLTMSNFVGILLILMCTTLVITRRDITRRILAIRTLFPKAGRHLHRHSSHRGNK